MSAADTTAPPRADARRNREAVLEAAVRLLGERPDASMQEVADASGVGRTTVYRHFPNREDLVKALFTRVINESMAMSWRLVEQDPPAADLYRQMGREALEITYRYRFLRAHNEMLEDAMAEAGVGLPNDPMFDYLTRAQERGELRADMPRAVAVHDRPRGDHRRPWTRRPTATSTPSAPASWPARRSWPRSSSTSLLALLVAAPPPPPRR